VVGVVVGEDAWIVCFPIVIVDCTSQSFAHSAKPTTRFQM